MTDAVFWIWIVNFFGCDKKRIWDIYHTFENPKLMCEAVMNGTVPLTQKETQRVGKFSLTDAEKILSYCNRRGYGIITYSDTNYPKCLNDIKNPPCMLFYIGDINLLNNDYNITVVGSRNSSYYSRRITEKMCSGLVDQGFNVVSGFALGIDSVAHKTAIRCGGKTIAVLGCGLDVEYPVQNAAFKNIVAQKGVIVSEYLPTEKPIQSNFPKRNRILAAASPATLVIEASAKSGTLITANLAKSLDRKIFCIPPCDIFDERYAGQEAVLRGGGVPVYSVDDITGVYCKKYSDKLKSENNSMDTYGFSKKKSHQIFVQQSFIPEEIKVSDLSDGNSISSSSEEVDISKLKSFLNGGLKSIDEIADFLNMSVPEATSFMLSLELGGTVIAEAGGRYKFY